VLTIYATKSQQKQTHIHNISINWIWGTPPVLVKGSRDPSVRSQRHSSLF